MKKSWIVIFGLVILGLIIYFSLKGTYNKMVEYDVDIDGKWAQVENNYQRRADLIPNLVNTVKGYADFEKSTLTDVIEARSKATAVQVNADNLNAAALEQFQQAQDALSSALSRLMVVVERYPELKANQNFMELQAQLEGTENRIANARRKFNDSTKEYNTYIRKFPQNMLAGIFGFNERPFFEAAPGTEEVPEVQF